jgi:hypothetical protein
MLAFSAPLAALVIALWPAGLPTAPRNDSIRQQDLKADLFFLAGDGFRGRLTGTPENDLASAYIISRFERLGLEPVGPSHSYSHRFLLSTATLGDSSSSLSMRDRHSELRLAFQAGVDFTPASFSRSGRAVGPVEFAGFGISAPELGHDDYKNLDLLGKIAVVLNHEPGENDPESPFDGVVMSEAATPLRKALTAQQKGAVGILFVADVHNHAEPENFEALARSAWPLKPARIPAYTLEDWVERVHIPAARISTALARNVLSGGMEDRLESLSRSSEKPRGGSAFPQMVGPVVTLTTDVRHHIVPDRNIMAAIQGSDSKLKDEWVIISCHHDHNGADGDRVFNGADDNGSGTVGMIEIAEAYALAAQEGRRPKRSILFAAFNSEERGLLGSWAFVEHPPFPLEQIVAVLNMDMIGRDEEVRDGGGPRFRGLPLQSAESNKCALNLLGYSRCPALATTIDRANAPFGLTLKKVLDNNASNLLRRSDQWPFLQKGVPAVFFHTGLHPDYHTPDDRPEKINYAKMERIARLVHQASWDLAEAAGRPRLDRIH